QRPEVFQAVGVDLPAHILPCVVNHLKLVELGQLPLPVLLSGIGVEVRSLLNIRHDVPANSTLGEVLRNGGADAARLSVFAPLQDAEHRSLVHAASAANDPVAFG